MVKHGKELRPRKVIVFDEDFNDEWRLGLPDDEMWTDLKRHFPNLSKAAEPRLRQAIECCVDRLAAQRIKIDQGGKLLANVKSYKRLEMELRQAAATWKDISGGPCSIRTHFDGLEAMAQEAKRLAAALRSRKTKAEPVGRPWQEFVRSIYQCLREAKLDPTVNGRGYDQLSNSPSRFQSFMLALNAALPKKLKEPAKNTPAFAKTIMRAMQPAK